MHTKLDNDTDSILQTSSNDPTIRNVDNAKNLINTMKEIDIVYQDGEITDEHIRISKHPKIFVKILSYVKEHY